MKNTLRKSIYLMSLIIGTTTIANASLLVTSSQTVDVTGKYLPPNPSNVNDPRLDLSASYNGNNFGGISDFDFNLADKGIDNGRAYWEIGIQQSTLRSLSDLKILMNNSSGSYTTDLNVDVKSNISYADTITVRDLTNGQEATPSNLFVRFQVDITGEMYNDVVYNSLNSDGASTANYSSEANFASRIANSGGDANEDWQVGQTNSQHSNGFFSSNVLERDFINSTVTFTDLLWSNQAIFFGWSFSELFKVELENIDAGPIDINLQNDLGSTFVTRASVFDASGNWLSNYAVESSEGFLYQQVSDLANTPSPVNAPTMSLFAFLLFAGHTFLKKIKGS